MIVVMVTFDREYARDGIHDLDIQNDDDRDIDD